MRYYVFLNSNIKQLLNDKLINSNHINEKWSVFLDQQSYAIIGTTETLETLSSTQLEKHLILGDYLVELNEKVLDEKIDEIPYTSYRSLSSDLNSYPASKVEMLYDRAKTVVKYSNVNAIFIKELRSDMIKKVYRFNSVTPHWVECDIVNNKLIHKIQ